MPVILEFRHQSDERGYIETRIQFVNGDGQHPGNEYVLEGPVFATLLERLEKGPLIRGMPLPSAKLRDIQAASLSRLDHAQLFPSQNLVFPFLRKNFLPTPLETLSQRHFHFHASVLYVIKRDLTLGLLAI